VSDSRVDTVISGFGSLARTLRIFNLNTNGTLGTEVATTTCAANVATCRSVTLPSRTRLAAIWTVRHSAPSTSSFQMDCSVVASDFDTTCPLFSDDLVSSAKADSSPQAQAVLDLSGKCAMRRFEGNNGCSTIFLSDNETEQCGNGSGNGQSACYVDKALWEPQRFNLVNGASSVLTQVYRNGAVSSAWTNLNDNRTSTTTRSLP
jgi:hypothetical protein